MSRSNTPICPACSASASRSRIEPQALLGQLALADVGHDAHQPLGPAVGPARQHQAAPGQPEGRAVGADDPVFGDERVLPVGEGAESPPPGGDRPDAAPPAYSSASPPTWPRPSGRSSPNSAIPSFDPGPGAGREVGLPGAHPAGMEGGAVARFSFASAVSTGSGVIRQGFWRQGRLWEAAAEAESAPSYLPGPCLRPPPHPTDAADSHRRARPRLMGFGPGRPDHGATVSPRLRTSP